MRLLSPSLAATLLTLGLGVSVQAQDCPGCGGLGAARAPEQGPPSPVLEVDDDDEKTFTELETQLNALLIVDESGAIVVRKEFADSLPIPAERVQQMLGQFVELAPDGKIKVRDRETVRPYLPMLKRFLSPESMERMRAIQGLPPDQRRDAMRKMFNQGQGGQTEPQREERQPEARPAPRPTPAPPPAPTPAPRDDERARQLERRLSAVEDSLKRMEGLLERSLKDRAEGGRDESLHQQTERRRGLLGGGSDLIEHARVLSRGLKKLREVTQPEDMEAIGRALARFREQLEPGDLRDRDALMKKLQDSVDPADMGRMMEIFSEFIGTPEGRAMADEVEKTVARIEELVNSGDGEGTGRALDRLQGLLGGEKGNGRGLRDQLERLIRGRDREEQRSKDEDEHLHKESRPERAPSAERTERPRATTRPGDRPRGLPEGAKLY